MVNRLSKSEYARYEVKATYFRGKKRYGRTTLVIDKQTRKQITFMGALTKGEAIKAFKKHFRIT